MKAGDEKPPMSAELAGMLDGLEVQELMVEPGSTLSAGRVISLLQQLPPDTPVYRHEHDGQGPVCRRIERLFLSVAPPMIVVW